MTQLDINIPRIRVLAKFWKSVDPKTVNLDTWKCETHACLAGHAANIPEFADAGYYLTWVDCGVDMPAFKEFKSHEAVEEFFGADAFEYIFAPSGQCTLDSMFGPHFQYSVTRHHQLATLRMEYVLEKFDNGEYTT